MKILVDSQRKNTSESEDIRLIADFFWRCLSVYIVSNVKM